MYAACIRTLLGVRKTTATDLCLAETGLPPLATWIQSAQKSAIDRLIRTRGQEEDDPFAKAWRLVNLEPKTPCAKYIIRLMDSNPAQETEEMMIRIQQSTRTKFITYRTLMNPRLEEHRMYQDPTVPEYQRLTASRFRLSSHNMAVERGRWSRTPRDQRLCHCGAVQDEAHVLADCAEGARVRDAHPDINFNLPAFFDEQSLLNMLQTCYQLSKTFV